MPEATYSRERVVFDDGAWSMAHRLTIPADKLKFEDLHPVSSYVRQQDIARMLYARAKARGEAHPQIVTWTAMQTDRRADQALPGLDYETDDGERLISANSFITHALRKMLSEGWLQLHEYLGDTYEWKVEIPGASRAWRRRAEEILAWLEESIQLDLYPNLGRGTYAPRHFEGFDASRNFARIGRCDFIRHFVQNHERAAVFNTSHFLHERDDLISHHSGYGDAIGLMLAEGAILRPPIYRRGALLYDGGGWKITPIGLEDIILILPGGATLRPGADRAEVNPEEPAPIALYTRAGGIRRGGGVMDRTPDEPKRLEFVLVNRQVVGWKRGGKTGIPQNGFVLSLSEGALPAAVVESIIADAWVEYEFAESGVYRAGIQAGPILLSGGAPIADAARSEEFRPSAPGRIGISPVRAQRHSGERKARTAVGIRDDGDLVVISVDGCEDGARTPQDSGGASLDELGALLLEAGAVDGLNLSGEGSSHLFVGGGLANLPSDRRGRAGVIFERMLPSIGIVG